MLTTNLTLADLQKQLNQLQPGEKLTIAGSTYHRLFGDNDLARMRLDHFARGHGCAVHQFDHAATFHKAG
jgi:hypothetical protein